MRDPGAQSLHRDWSDKLLQLNYQHVNCGVIAPGYKVLSGCCLCMHLASKSVVLWQCWATSDRCMAYASVFEQFVAARSNVVAGQPCLRSGAAALPLDA